MTKYKQIFNPLSKIGFDKVNQEAQIDAALDENSENAVQNKVVTAAISGKRCTTGAEQCRFDSGMPIRACSRGSCTQMKNVRARSLTPYKNSKSSTGVWRNSRLVIRLGLESRTNGVCSHQQGFLGPVRALFFPAKTARDPPAFGETLVC